MSRDNTGTSISEMLAMTSTIVPSHRTEGDHDPGPSLSGVLAVLSTRPHPGLGAGLAVSRCPKEIRKLFLSGEAASK